MDDRRRQKLTLPLAMGAKKFEIHVYIYYKCSFFYFNASVIQFRYLYRDNCILNTDIYI
jgi:hypothetical protein